MKFRDTFIEEIERKPKYNIFKCGLSDILLLLLIIFQEKVLANRISVNLADLKTFLYIFFKNKGRIHFCYELLSS